jgi:putative ATP-dependent endonuclease of the OLD family
MKISKIKVNNYRLLKSFKLDVEEKLSLVIGKNNTGKTSLFSVLNKFLNPSNRKGFLYNDFNTDFKKIVEGSVVNAEIEKEKWQDLMISMLVYIDYEEKDNLENISELILNLDPTDHTLILSFEYFLNYDSYLRLRKDFDGFKSDKFPEKGFDFFLNKNVALYFKKRNRVLESGNETNSIEIDDVRVRRIINIQTIPAKRDIDNEGSSSESGRALSHFSAEFYKSRENVNTIDLSNFQRQLLETDKIFNDIYKDIFKPVTDNIKKFGSNGSTEPLLEVISNLREEKLLSDNTSVIYSQDGHTLPEDYNGLGYLNLFAIIYCIHIKLDLLKKHGIVNEKPSDINLLFIEEPEAHTHPQLQYAFIRNIKEMLEQESKGIVLHTIISTHSSHIVSQSEFDDIKYFHRDFNDNNILVKNLSELQKIYINEESKAEDKDIQKRNFQFLKQYLTLEKAELFFADKAIFIEGDTERILMPAMMKKLDLEKSKEESYSPLMSQNISIIEVGAYAHIFEHFLLFLGIKALIITDIDSVKDSDIACPVCVGKKTSNASIKHFLKGKTFDNLKRLPKEEKILKFEAGKWVCDINGHLRIAFQTEQDSYHARSFEDSFIALNYDFINSNKPYFYGLKCRDDFDKDKYTENSIYEITEKCIAKKTVFATDILYFSNDDMSNWSTPQYIKEGLEWLA